MSYSKLTPLYPYNQSLVEIKWSRPIDYDKAMEKEEDGLENVFFYKIVAQSPQTGAYKLLYIGKSYNQYVTKRLKNADHKRKRIRFQRKFQKHKLKVSFGALENSDRKSTKMLIDKVESLLIYAHSNDDTPYLSNTLNSWNHGVKRSYRILNSGFRRDNMLKEIVLGVFYKE